MLIFVLLCTFPVVLLLTWAVAMYLTWYELRGQPMGWKVKLWWYQLTFLFHFVGYLALRGWLFYRRRRATA